MHIEKISRQTGHVVNELTEEEFRSFLRSSEPSYLIDGFCDELKSGSRYRTCDYFYCRKETEVKSP